MKTIQNQLYKIDGNLKIETCKLYKQGHSFKVWLPAQLSKRFLEDYKYDRLLAVIDEFSGVLLLYKITTKEEFEKAFEYASKVRGEVFQKIKE